MKLDDGRVELFQGKLIQNSLTNALKNGKNLFAGALVKGALFTSPAAFVKSSNFQIARPCLEIRPIETPEAKPDAAYTEVSEEGETEWQRRVGGFMNMAVKGICFLGTLLSCFSCKHSLAISSVPADAEVFIQFEGDQEKRLLGKTPFVTDISPAPSTTITIEKPGYQPIGLATDFEANGKSTVSVTLSPIDDVWLKNVPRDVSAKLQDESLQELLELQSKIYSSTPEQMKAIAEGLAPKYGHLSAFHFLLGNYSFYRSDFQAAQKSYQTALNLQPKNAQAQRMLIVTEMKMLEAARTLNAKAIDEIATAAKRIASLANGFVAESRSVPTLAKPDGYRITLPSDALFAPITAKIIPSGRNILEQLSEFLKKISSPIMVKIEAHTDSDPIRELQIPASGSQTKVNKMNQTSWELSSARAAAAMLFLRTLGVKATSWSIAGFADSQPLVTDSKYSFDERAINRRLVFDINLSTKDEAESLNEVEIDGLKKSLQLFLYNSEQNRVNTYQTEQQNLENVRVQEGISNQTRSNLMKRNSGQNQGSVQQERNSSSEVYDSESAAKRSILNRRLKKANPAINQNVSPQIRAPRGNSEAVPVPRIPKLNQ